MRPSTPNERLRENHSRLRTSDLDPRMPGRTCPHDPLSCPLWRCEIYFEEECQPMIEVLRAETASKAKHYISNRYRRVRLVKVKGREAGL